MPNIHKEGYEESQSASAAADAREEREEGHARRNPAPHNPLADHLPPPARPYPFNDPLADHHPRRPLPGGDFPPPGFDDEYDLERPLRGMAAPHFPGATRSPFNIGHDDLNPPGLGPFDPLRGSFVGGGGPGGFGGAGGGGMHPTFDDPMFGGRGGGGGGNPYGGGQGNAPPGARYDPVGPGGAPRGSGGRPPNPFGGFGNNDFL